MARLGVLLFTAVVVGVAVLVGSTLLTDSPSLLGPLAGEVERLMPVTEPVDPADTRQRVFTVKPGATAAQIGEALQQQGLVRSALGFRLVVERREVGQQLAAGDYELSPSMSTEEIVGVLASGQVKRGIVATIPEGWRAEQIANRLAAEGFTSREEFLQAVANPRSVPSVELLGEQVPPTLEGYLFPETYEVRSPVSGVQAADMMVRMFLQRAWEPLRQAAQERPGLSAHDLLTVASIVEREAQHPAERPIVASVYLNRLKIGMPLQADPTVQYAVANQDLQASAAYDYWKRQLTTADLQLDSLFNTYVQPGLPPAPIANPGLASIQAVINPAETDYLYFVARGDGSHLFAHTLAEHNANIARTE